MKKNILILFVLANFFAKAQTPYTGYIPFPEDSAQWSEWFSGYDGIGNFFTVSTQYKMKGDTVLNGIAYNKIYKSFDLFYGANDTVIHSFIRQDTAQKKVFVRYPISSYADSSDYLLYDFSLQNQDTFSLKFVSDKQLHRFKVFDEDTVQFNLDFRRVLGVHPNDTSAACPSYVGCTWGIDCDNGTYYAEGMGGGLHPFYLELAPDTCRSPSIYFFNLECFWHNGQYVFGGSFCDYSTGIHEDFIGKENRMLIYPNPVSEISTLNIAAKKIKQLCITDLAGHVIKTALIMNGKENDYRINSNDFANGAYLISAYDDENKIHVAKFMVIKK